MGPSVVDSLISRTWSVSFAGSMVYSRNGKSHDNLMARLSLLDISTPTPEKRGSAYHWLFMW